MFWISHLGKTDYKNSLEFQFHLRKARIEKKIPDLLLLTSHSPVFTLGRRDCQKDFITSPEEIQKDGIQIFQTNRGGKITYHGPGQIVGYFIVDIRPLALSIPKFVERIEELIIQTLADFQIQSHQDPEHPGVWSGNKKLAALGLHFDRGVSMHGFALNVNPDLNHYRHIIPCGIRDREVGSMEMELKKNGLQDGSIEIALVKEKMIEKVEKLFLTSIQIVSRSKLESVLSSD